MTEALFPQLKLGGIIRRKNKMWRGMLGTPCGPTPVPIRGFTLVALLLIPTGLNLPTEAEFQFCILFFFLQSLRNFSEFHCTVVSCICHVLS